MITPLNDTLHHAGASSQRIPIPHQASESTGQNLQNSFLTLLVAQLRNQDPTNPLQNNELTTQLAQINTVNGIEKLNTTLGTISGQIDRTQSLQAHSLIGRGVMVPGNAILVGAKNGTASTTPFGLELERAADHVTANISNGNGMLVRRIDMGSFSAGVHAFSWDGLLDDGTTAPEGAYKLTLTASHQGNAQVIHPLSFARVNAVTHGTANARLDLGLAGSAALHDVRRVL